MAKCVIYKIHSTEKGNNSREQTECGNVEREKKEKKMTFTVWPLVCVRSIFHACQKIDTIKSSNPNYSMTTASVNKRIENVTTTGTDIRPSAEWTNCMLCCFIVWCFIHLFRCFVNVSVLQTKQKSIKLLEQMKIEKASQK